MSSKGWFRRLSQKSTFIFVMMALAVASPEKALAQEVGATTETKPAASEKSEDAAIKEGHSAHGEVFNEGLRQAAYLMQGVGKVRFPVTTAHEDARKFVEQGVAQLHGFWYFESERSFRQGSDARSGLRDCLLGHGDVQPRQSKRAKGFIAEGVKRKDKVARREQLLIEAFDRYINAKEEKEEEKKSRANRYVADLEDILIEFPTDIETKAFLCEFLLVRSQRGVGNDIQSRDRCHDPGCARSGAAASRSPLPHSFVGR